MALLDQLRQRRDTARQAAEEILERASTEGRDLTPEEFVQHREQVQADHDASDEIDRLRDQQISDLRAAQARNGRPVLSRQNAEIARAFRSAIYSKNPAPIEFGTEMLDEWPDDLPDVQGRTGKVKVHTRDLEQRDTLKSTATQGLSTDVYTQIVEHLVDTS